MRPAALALMCILLVPSTQAHSGAPAADPLLAGSIAPGIADGSPALDASQLSAAEATNLRSARQALEGAPPDLSPKPLGYNPGQGPLQFVCAKPADGSGRFQGASANAVYGCPIRVYDFAPGGNAFSPFGNIRLAVQDDDPTNVAFFTLHGGQASDGPTNRSRIGNTHTTFTTPDMGISWVDAWTPGCPETSYGEAAAGAMARGGNVTQAYLWHTGDGSTLDAWWLGPPDEAQAYMDSYCDDAHLRLVTQGRIGAVDIEVIASGGRERDVLTWQQADAGSAGSVRFAVGERNGLSNATWGTGQGGGMAGLNATLPQGWVLAQDATIRGCSAASDTVAWEGRVFVACTAGKGYEGRKVWDEGDVEVWSFDPMTMTSERLSTAPVRGHNVRLATTSDGYFAATATHLEGEQEIGVAAAFGWEGRHWDPASRDLGAILHGMMGSHPVRSAHVTALAFASDTKTLFLVYHEWNRRDGLPEAPALALPDPDSPPPRLVDHQKMVVTLDACTAPITASLLVLGTSPDVYQQDPQAAPIYDDLSDGLQAVRMPQGEEWVFFAVDDYGAAQFGAIRALSGGAGTVCPVLPPPPAPPAAIFPQAVASTSAATTAVASVVGVASIAMVGYLLAVKRRVSVAAAAEDK